MTLAHHQTAERDKRDRAYAEFLSAEHRRDDDVAACSQSAVGPQRHMRAQIVERQNLIGLGEPQLPWRAGEFDRCLRARACAPDMAGDEDDVGFGFRNACGDGADAAG